MNRYIAKLLCTVFFLASTCTQAETASTIAEMLEQAIYEKETNNDFSKAIQLFTQIIENGLNLLNIQAIEEM